MHFLMDHLKDKYQGFALDSFTVYTTRDGRRLVEGYSAEVRLGFEAEFYIGNLSFPTFNPVSYGASETPSETKALQIKNLLFFKREEGKETWIVENWAKEGLKLVYLMSLLKDHLDAFASLSGDGNVELWLPLSCLSSLTPNQIQWLYVLFGWRGEPSSSIEVNEQAREEKEEEPSFMLYWKRVAPVAPQDTQQPLHQLQQNLRTILKL